MIRRAVLVFAVLILAFGPTLAAADTLHLYNWTDYIGEGNLEEFNAETSIKTTLDAYDSTDIMETKLLVGSSGYDWVMTPAPNGARLIGAKALLPIDWSQLPNVSNIDPAIAKMVQAYDPEKRFLVPYAWGTTGIAYNDALTTKFAPGKPMDTLAAVFDPESLKALKKCNVAMIDEPTEVVPMVLKYLGLDPASESDADLKLVETHLAKIRRYIRHFKTSQIATELATGELCAAIAYNGDVATATKAADDAKKGIKISYSVPREGTIVWVDTLAIPAGTKNTAVASKLINFLLRPKSGAAFSTSTGYATANAESKPLLDVSLRENSAVYPSEATKATLFVVPPTANSGYLKKRTRMWTRFRNARS